MNSRHNGQSLCRVLAEGADCLSESIHLIGWQHVDEVPLDVRRMEGAGPQENPLAVSSQLDDLNPAVFLRCSSLDESQIRCPLNEPGGPTGCEHASLGDVAHRDAAATCSTDDEKQFEHRVAEPRLFLERAAEDVLEPVRSAEQAPEHQDARVVGGVSGRGEFRRAVHAPRLGGGGSGCRRKAAQGVALNTA